jgi:hypothetical protein
MFKAALCLAIAIVSISPAVGQASYSAVQCVKLLDQFRPFATTTSHEFFRESEQWEEQQKVNGPLDFDGNGTPEIVYLLTGRAPSLYRPAWHMLVLVEPSAEDRSDGHVASEMALQHIQRQDGQRGLFVRAYPLNSLDHGYKMKGNDDGKKVPPIAQALAEVGMLQGKPALKIRGEPNIRGYDHATGRVMGEPVRYEFLARLNTDREIEILCSWKLVAQASN